MSDQIKVGVIGFGQMGQVHAGIYNKLPGVKLTAVCEYNDDRRALCFRTTCTVKQ